MLRAMLAAASPKNRCLPWNETWHALSRLLFSFSRTVTPPRSAWATTAFMQPKSRPTTAMAALAYAAVSLAVASR